MSEQFNKNSNGYGEGSMNPIRQEKYQQTEDLSQLTPTEAEDYVLSVVQALDQRRIDVERLAIRVDGRTVFGMKDGGLDQWKTRINGKQAEFLRQALNDPTSFKGTVKITQGKKVLLYVEKGRVITDAIGITKESAKMDIKSPESVNEGLYKRYSQGVKEEGLAGAQKIAMNALQDGVKREQVVEIMQNYNPAYQKLADRSSQEEAQRTVVSQAEVKLMESQMGKSQGQSQEKKVSKSRGRTR